MSQRALKVALLGFGTVGASVARILVERPELAGRLQLTHVFNRDVARKRAAWMPVLGHLDRRLRAGPRVGARHRRRGGRRREPRTRVGEPGDRARVVGGDGEQDAARGARSRAAESGGRARRRAAVRGGGRRRRAADSRRSRRAGRRSADRRRGHSQRHVQLHPQPHVGDARADGDGARRRAAARIRGGRSERRRRWPRCRGQAGRARRRRVSPASPAGRSASPHRFDR